MKRGKWRWILGGIAVLVVVLLVVANVMRAKSAGITAVQFARVRQEDITARVRAPGKIEALTQVKISADIPGKIVRLAVKEGDHVRQGNLMLQLDDTQYRAAADQAVAALASARENLTQAQHALTLQQTTYKRQQALWQQKLLSQAEWDMSQNQMDNAATALVNAHNEVSRAQAALQGANDNLRKTRFLAPFDGVVSALNVEQGEIVITGTMNNPGTEIMTFSDLSKMIVRTDVDETDVVGMKLGQKAKISVDAVPDTSFAGTVIEIGNTAKRSITSTVEGQTDFEVKVAFDQLVPQVRPGMTADVDIETATHTQALGVPIQAVVVRTQRELDQAARKKGAPQARRPAKGTEAVFAAEDDTVGRKDKDITGVFVNRAGVATFVPVRTGIASETSIEVFGPVKAGDVVVAGPYKALRELKPNGKVKAMTAAQAGKATK
ncbi:MAG TPA: efflux RND transporter periplasmic adaptor subunit [Candidatus Eisenbacteria bacterium]|nr:efflux RND transporter periplasmic adaptor subunit [Candidatus Eisenbacteria bacterium]